MFSFLFKKEDRLKNLIFDYLETLGQTQEVFAEALTTCLSAPHCESFDFLIDRTHKFESKADDIFDEINDLMYGKALIPESRADIMGLLDAVETIPRLFERTLYVIQTQRLVLPDFLVMDVKELIRISLESCELMGKQIRALLERQEGIRSLLNTIDTNESHCDHIERRLTIKLFDSDLPPYDKLQFKELFEQMGEISDRTLWVSRKVNIMRMTRRV